MPASSQLLNGAPLIGLMDAPSVGSDLAALANPPTRRPRRSDTAKAAWSRLGPFGRNLDAASYEVASKPPGKLRGHDIVIVGCQV